jgi:hypothetical protein
MLSEGLYTYAQDLTAIHLGTALGFLQEVRCLAAQPDVLPEPNRIPMKLIKIRQHSISSIVHAYSGLESAVNSTGYKLFFDKDSPHYLTDRDLPLKRLIESWEKTLPVADKLCFLLQRRGKDLEPRRLQELRELNNLRNWLVHGFNYKTTLLLQDDAGGQSYSVLDREDSCNWAEKFLHTKFNSLDMLGCDDATTATRIVVESLVALADATGEMYSAWSWWGNSSFLTFVARPGVGTDIGELLGRAETWF